MSDTGVHLSEIGEENITIKRCALALGKGRCFKLKNVFHQLPGDDTSCEPDERKKLVTA